MDYLNDFDNKPEDFESYKDKVFYGSLIVILVIVIVRDVVILFNFLYN